MSSLTVIPRIDPHERIIAELRGENDRLRREVESLRQALSDNMSQDADFHRGLNQVCDTMRPLFEGLCRIFSEIDRIPGARPGSSPRVKSSEVWESWKGKLSGTAAKSIDALLLHGEMTAEQLRIHLGCATRTCYNIIGELNRAKLINKNGGRISLKEL